MGINNLIIGDLVFKTPVTISPKMYVHYTSIHCLDFKYGFHRCKKRERRKKKPKRNSQEGRFRTSSSNIVDICKVMELKSGVDRFKAYI